jgi:hypothetical protein
MKNESSLLAGVVLRRVYGELMDELERVKGELGPEWEAERWNRAGRRERFYPVLDGLYKLARGLREDGEVLINATEDGRPKTGMVQEEARGELVLAREYSGAREYSVFDTGMEGVKVDGGDGVRCGKFGRLVEWMFGIDGGKNGSKG